MPWTPGALRASRGFRHVPHRGYRKGASVDAYTTSDGERFNFEGRAWLHPDDMVVLDTSSRGMDAPIEERLDTRFELRRSELLTIEYRKPDAVANSFIAGFCSALVIFVIWAEIQQ